MRLVFSFPNFVFIVSSSVMMRRYRSAWLYMTLCLQVSGWNDCLCSKVSVGFTYKVLSSFCSLLMNIVVSRKCTWFFSVPSRIGLWDALYLFDLGIVTIRSHCEAKL